MDKVLAVRDDYRAQQWALVIQEYQMSGLKKDFCEQKPGWSTFFNRWSNFFLTFTEV